LLTETGNDIPSPLPTMFEASETNMVTIDVISTETPEPIIEEIPTSTVNEVSITPSSTFYNTPIISETPTTPEFQRQKSTIPLITAFDNRFSLPHKSGEVLVKFTTEVDILEWAKTYQSNNVEILENINDLGYALLQVPDDQISTFLFNLSQDSQVEMVEPNYLIRAEDVFPNDPGYPSQWGLNAIQAPSAWEINPGSSNIIIAIIDSGVDLTHPDLSQKMLPGWDFIEGDAIPQDDFGHGTHVAGIAAAMSNNNLGVSGVSWGAKILPVRVLDANGNGTYAGVAAGIIYAVDQGAQILNLSLGGSSPSGVLQDAVNYAYNHGVVIVAAVGNSGNYGVLYPARCDHVIGVAAVDSSLNRPWFSNYGSEVDLAAPGVSIYSTEPGFRGSYGFRDGTSMAAPYVSGSVALLMSLPGNGVAGLAVSQLIDSAMDIGPEGWDVYSGAGLIQLKNAYQLAIPAATITSVPTSIRIVEPNEVEPENLIVASPSASYFT
jgi:thermitase